MVSYGVYWRLVRQDILKLTCRAVLLLSGGSASGGSTTNQTYDLVYNTGDGFVQINNAASNALYYNSPTKVWMLASQTITTSTSTLQKFQLYTAFYVLKMDVYNALEYNYLQVPLLFPIQTVSNVKFTSALGSSSSMILQNTATLSHCDTVFVVFPKTIYVQIELLFTRKSNNDNINNENWSNHTVLVFH